MASRTKTPHTQSTRGASGGIVWNSTLFERLESNTPLAYIRFVEFRWDPAKNQGNIETHGLSFEEASELFNLPENLILEEYDFEHSINEDRIISIGPILRGVIIVVSVERDDGNILRLISARFASMVETKRYEEMIARTNDE